MNTLNRKLALLIYMKKHSEYIDFLNEVFEEFGPIEARKMFGGYGIYHDGLMFALVAENTLYLKADESTKNLFESRDLPQFEYERKDKSIKMSYYLAPDEIFDDREEAAIWASHAYEAALNSQK
jgi:DNA transformation protein